MKKIICYDLLLQVPFCKDESVQLFRVAFCRSDFLQNPYSSRNCQKYFYQCSIQTLQFLCFLYNICYRQKFIPEQKLLVWFVYQAITVITQGHLYYWSDLSWWWKTKLWPFGVMCFCLLSYLILIQNTLYLHSTHTRRYFGKQEGLEGWTQYITYLSHFQV